MVSLHTILYKKKQFYSNVFIEFKLASLVLLIVFSLPLHSCSPVQNDFFSEGMDYYNQGKYSYAIELFDSALQTSPESIIYFSKAKALNKMNRNTEAVNTYSRAIEIQPNYAEAYLNRGLGYLELQKFAESLRDFNTCLGLDENLYETYFARAYLNSYINNYEDAITDYNKYISLMPDDARGYVNRGNVRGLMEDPLGAIDDFTTAIELDPENINAFISRGTDKGILGDYEGAIEDFTSAINLDTSAVLYYFMRGEAKFLIDDFAGAIADYEIMIQRNPRDGRGFYAKGLAELNMLNKNKGCADLKKAAELGFVEAFSAIQEYCIASPKKKSK